MIAFKKKFEEFLKKVPRTNKPLWEYFWQKNQNEVEGFALFIKNHSGKIYDEWLKQIFGHETLSCLAEVVFRHQFYVQDAELRIFELSDVSMIDFVAEHPELQTYANIILLHFCFLSKKTIKKIYKRLKHCSSFESIGAPYALYLACKKRCCLI